MSMLKYERLVKAYKIKETKPLVVCFCLKCNVSVACDDCAGTNNLAYKLCKKIRKKVDKNEECFFCSDTGLKPIPFTEIV